MLYVLRSRHIIYMTGRTADGSAGQVMNIPPQTSEHEGESIELGVSYNVSQSFRGPELTMTA